jgi:hypothetical protein
MSLRNTASATLAALALSASLFTTAASADSLSHGMKAREQGIESSTAQATMPAKVGDSLVTTPCTNCVPVMLRVTETTRFFVDRNQVTLAELNKYLAKSGPRSLGVFYDPRSRTLNRLVVR